MSRFWTRCAGMGFLLCLAACGQEDATKPGAISLASPYPTIVEATGSVDVAITVVGGREPYVFSAPSAGVPPGLSLTGDGRLVGSPEKLGDFSFSARVADRGGFETLIRIDVRVINPDQSLYPSLLSQRPLTEEELAYLLGSGSMRRMRSWAVSQGLRADLGQAVFLDYDRQGADLVGVPLEEPDGTPSWGAIYLVHPFTNLEEGMSYRAFPSETAPTMTFYGGDGSAITHHFTAERRWVDTTVQEGSGCGQTWQDFKKWLSSESGAEDLPWWLDLLCGIACGDALIGTHSPWSISGCIHCIGAYIAACVTVGPATITSTLN